MNRTTEKMLKNKDLRNGVLNSVIESLLGWVDEGTQGKIETNIFVIIEDAINCNISEYFDDFQMYYITNKFNSSEDFLNNFYEVNPDVSTVVRAILQYSIKPIKLILDGKKLDKPLDHYYKIFNYSLKTLQNLKN